MKLRYLLPIPGIRLFALARRLRARPRLRKFRAWLVGKLRRKSRKSRRN